MSESSVRGGKNAGLSPQQKAYCQEWRDLCYTLERAQGDELCHHCHDKYQFAKTYSVFGRDLDRTISEIRREAAGGVFRFFTDRGIPADVMTPAIAERMLKDWQDAVETKKGRLALVFRYKFGESIDECITAYDSSGPLSIAKSLEESDALALLSRYSVDPDHVPGVERLEASIEQLKAQVAQWTDSHAAEFSDSDDLRRTVARLRQDVDRILAALKLEPTSD